MEPVLLAGLQDMRPARCPTTLGGPVVRFVFLAGKIRLCRQPGSWHRRVLDNCLTDRFLHCAEHTSFLKKADLGLLWMDVDINQSRVSSQENDG